MYKFIFIFFVIVLFSGASTGWSQTYFQSYIPTKVEVNAQTIQTTSALYFQVDLNALKSELQAAPYRENANIYESNFYLQLPNMKGGTSTFRVLRNQTMHPELNLLFPDILTFDGININDPYETAKFDITPQGFHGMIYSPNHSTIFFDPIHHFNQPNKIMAYYKKDFITEKSMSCDVGPVEKDFEKLIKGGHNVPTKQYGSCQLRTYRLALAATGEYSTFHGGTVALAQAAQATTMNRVNGVYEREMAITMVIVINNNLLVFTNAGTDPYTNGTPGTMITQNQTQCTNLIGSSNYDIGHVFGTNSGGLAGLGVVCINTQKARGVTGSGAPVGDPFDIDYVAHEMGHQFAGNHTQNNACNRNNSTAAETGSGITIMGYAGICAPNVGSNSIDHFHAVSLTEISNFVTSAGHTCPVVTSLSNVAPQISSTVGNISVPISTPFALHCIATDADNDALTYNWEQTDVAVSTQSPVPTATGGPSFRSYVSSPDSVRYFPNLTDLSNNGPFTWESLPSVARTMNFRISVRDNHSGGGCTDFDNVTVTTVASAGPFVVTYPSATGITLSGGTAHTVTWSVANTSAAPISAATVRILLSTDGGLTYPTILTSGTANDGSQAVSFPNINTTTARVMVISSAGTFFDISDNNFTIVQAALGYTITASPSSQSICQGSNAVYTVSTSAIGSYSVPINLSASNVPVGATVNFSPNTVNPGQSSTMTLSNLPAGNFNVTVAGNSGSINNNTTVAVNVVASSLPAVSLTFPANAATGVVAPVTFTWASIPAASYSIQISTSPSFSSIFAQATGLGTASFTGPAMSNGTTYYWRVNAENGCSTTPYTTASFTTATCYSVSATDVPISISLSGTPTIASTINFGVVGTITSVTVPNVTGTHTWVQDLTFTLISPDLTSTTLLSPICGSLDNFNLGFDDASPLTSVPCPPTSGLVYQPVGSLSGLAGETSNGNWVLQIADGANQDGGVLTAWEINICLVPTCSPTVPVVAGTYAVSNTITDGGGAIYSSIGCDLIGVISDAAGGNVLGGTNVSSTLLTAIPTPNVEGYLYGRRSYTVSPNSDGEAVVTFYFTQADFDNYNANNVGFLDLPTSGNNVDPLKDNFRILRTDGSGFTISAPQGSFLNWNGTDWEYTVTMTSVNATFDFTTMPSCVGVNVNNLQASNITNTSALLTWDNLITFPTHGWFSLQYRIVGSPVWTFGGTSNNGTTSKPLYGLLSGTNYEVQIRRHCSSQSEGAWSASVPFTTLSGGCSSPMILNSSVVAGNNYVTVTWSAVAGAGWYEFRYKPSSSSTWIFGGTIGGSAASKTIFGLISGLSYDIQGRTYCPNGDGSSWSNTVVGVTGSAPCSLPPILISPNATPTSITISWASVPGASWYSFQYKESSSSTWIFGGTASGATTAKTYNGLNSNTQYDFQARSYCSNNVPGNWSSTGQFSTQGSSALILNSAEKHNSEEMKSLQDSKQSIRVYPNPTTDKITVEIFLENEGENTTVVLMDMSGRKLQMQSFVSLGSVNSFSMNLETLKTGMYTLFVYQEGKLILINKIDRL